MEPGIFGVWRPVLLWPEAISLHLDDAHLEAVLAHEAAHVRRRDNLTSLLHMLVEAVFWFHPLVWWMESQLVKERECACDEEVLLLCPPQAYAESILKVCELCIESPLTCVSGITGADLKRRVVQIMTAATARKLGVGARLLLVATGMMVVAAPFMLGQMRGARVVAAVKAAASVENRAMNFAARGASPVELESSAPPNSLIAPTALREFESSGTTELAQATAPADAGPQPRSRVLGMVLTIDPDASAHAMMAPGTIVSPAPVYPAEAKAAGIQGQVELNATVTSTGTVANITDVSGPQVLRQSALDAVMQWQFKQPDNGKSVAGVTNIKFLYQLPYQLPGMPPVVGPAPPAEEAAAGVKQYGGDVTAPLQIYKVEPEYTDLARTDKVQGTVTLSLVVDEHGVPKHVKVVRGLGDGLDEKAVDAVTRSRFKPGMEGGKAASVFLYYKADFALKDGFASLLAPTGPGPQNHYGVLKDGKFHNFLTGIDLTIPEGYAFAGCGMSSGNGEQAYISSQSKPNLAVWMRPVVEPLEGLRAGVRAKMVSKPGERGADWKERPESVRELTFSGKPGISVVADYMENGKPWVEYLIWINTGKTHTQFYGQAPVAQLALLEKNVDALANSAVIP
jgi:TonB family protein